MTEKKLMNVHDATSDVFTERERAVLNFVTTMSTNDTASADDAFAGMRPFFDEPQLVEIGLAVATLHGMNLFNNMFGIEPEGHPMESFTGVDKSMAAE
ncbi:MAG: hypothetical protein HOI95_19555 [Chromatiales bacterium]|jgi:alkylhydroperoxidase family enzyme|nr:hypothetical protein [Chromatiales bacterium]